MILRRLLKDLKEYTLLEAATAGAMDKIDVTGLAFDSRRVEAGNLFVAIPGGQTDGHLFIAQAIERGAVAIVGERPPAEVLLSNEVPYVRVPDSHAALAHLAAVWHGHPGREMTVIGVTGTDGKTTTVNLIQSIVAAAGHKTGMISTVNALIGDRYQDTGLHVTTPDALQVQGLLAQMATASTEVAILEATSHGLAQHRVTAAEFDVAVVTNITHEHLDYHGTWEQYCTDKGRLFRMLSASFRKPGVPKVAVLNVDDASYPYLRPIPADLQLTYAIDGDADVRATDIVVKGTEMTFHVHAPQGSFPICTLLAERYNVYNILAAVSTGLALDVPISAIQGGVAAVCGVIGRMERIDEGQDFTAIVDFAHTPNALRRVLETLGPQTQGRLIVVFGCAGLRDVYKREMMGHVAGQLADVTVITAEDPRTEDLDAIIEQIAQGCQAEGAREGIDFYRVPDRSEAIAFAIHMARPGDTVVTTGKAHERSMCFGATEYPWSEHQALRAALLERLGRAGEVVAPRLPTAGWGGES
jgi:UDP-N-acetylmuramoyl-L-alanyl-D-glutamate--2,6-diaminopimelate ligase